jgi:hypothetical protein
VNELDRRLKVVEMPQKSKKPVEQSTNVHSTSGFSGEKHAMNRPSKSTATLKGAVHETRRFLL